MPNLDTIYRHREQQRPHGDVYSWFQPAHLFMVQHRQRAVLELLCSRGFYPLSEWDILEVGCGQGGVLQEFLSFGADPRRIQGVDILDWRLLAGKRRNASLKLQCADGQSLPYPDHAFDLVLQFTMFSSIVEPVFKRQVAAEMQRVMRPGGAILWYDFWLNPFNRQVRGIRLPEIAALFPNATLAVRRITLAPPLLRLLAPRAWWCCSMLERLRLFNSHYLVLIQSFDR